MQINLEPQFIHLSKSSVLLQRYVAYGFVFVAAKHSRQARVGLLSCGHSRATRARTRLEPRDSITVLRQAFRHRLVASDPFYLGTLRDAVGGEEFACDQTFSFLAEPRFPSHTRPLLRDRGWGIIAQLFVLSMLWTQIFYPPQARDEPLVKVRPRHAVGSFCTGDFRVLSAKLTSGLSIRTGGGTVYRSR